MILQVTLGVVFGGIILFALYGWQQRRLEGRQRRHEESKSRLIAHWQALWGTPLHALRYVQALEYQKRTHGSLNSQHRAEWVLSRNLGAVWGENKIGRLERLSKETPEAQKDVDWNMHFDRLYHEAIREWAESVGLQADFDRWVDESMTELESTRKLPL